MTATEKRMRDLLIEALPIIEAEADRRDLADGDNPADCYWTEMRELADRFVFAIAELDRLDALTKEEKS